MTTHPTARLLGTLSGTALFLMIAYVGWEIFNIGGNDQYGVFALMVAFVFYVAPLALLNLGISVYLLVKGGAGRTLVWMWLPSLAFAALLVHFAQVNAMNSSKKEAIEAALPTVLEVHVNLSGHDLWLDPESGAKAPLKASTPEDFFTLFRKDSTDGPHDKMTAYHGETLASDFKSMTVYRAAPPLSPVSVPVIVMPTTPSNLAAIEATLPWSISRYYYYYHYADRVEVELNAVVITNAGTGERPAHMPVVAFYLHNLGKLPIVRVDMNGQHLPGTTALMPEDDRHCPQMPSLATGSLDAALTLRWQTAQANSAWQQATVLVPAWKSEKPAQGVGMAQAMDLFFMPDGSVTALRTQEVRIDADHTGTRFAGSVPALKPARCETRKDVFYGEAVAG